MPSIPARIQASLESTTVSYERVGKSGLFVSNPILGAMSIGSSDWGKWVLDEDEVWCFLNPPTHTLIAC